MGIYNVNRKRGVRIDFRTVERTRNQLDELKATTGKTQGILLDNMVDIATLLNTKQDVTIEELKEILHG